MNSNSKKDSDILVLERILNSHNVTNSCELANRLVSRFGSFRGVFAATTDELMLIDGVTEPTASFISVAVPAFRQALLRSMSEFLCSESDLVRLAVLLFMDRTLPQTYCVYLDGKNRVLSCDPLTEADRVREAVSGAARSSAAGMAVLSFLPTHAAHSSAKGAGFAQKVFKAVSIFGVTPMDYIEYCPQRFFSLSRAMRGDDRFIPVDQASESKYELTDLISRPYLNFYQKR